MRRSTFGTRARASTTVSGFTVVPAYRLGPPPWATDRLGNAVRAAHRSGPPPWFASAQACLIVVFVLVAAILLLLPGAASAVTSGPAGEGEAGPEAGESANDDILGSVLKDPCPACMATIKRAVQEGRLDEALASLYRLLLRVAPDLVPDRFRCLDHRMELVATIAEIHENMDRLLSKEVKVKAQYMGWSGDVGAEAGTPVTRSDWLLKDETGWIYVSGGAIRGLSPWRKGDQGKEVEVVGVVEAKQDGRPCLGFKDGRVLGKTGPAGGRPSTA
ncbi:MAG: hypothetical protein ACM3ZU_03325 [Bacteroidota bacterium]